MIFSVNLMAVLSSLANVGKFRPTFFGTVVQAFEALHGIPFSCYIIFCAMWRKKTSSDWFDLSSYERWIWYWCQRIPPLPTQKDISSKKRRFYLVFCKFLKKKATFLLYFKRGSVEKWTHILPILLRDKPESYWLFFIYISPFLVFVGTANPQSLVCF